MVQIDGRGNKSKCGRGDHMKKGKLAFKSEWEICKKKKTPEIFLEPGPNPEVAVVPTAEMLTLFDFVMLQFYLYCV